ncbi:radical SAM protein [Candidatus Bathyarchaeota archaeon]|nr:radical SAM protein [Candidatus Bathyarchaeota archaeon]
MSTTDYCLPVGDCILIMPSVKLPSAGESCPNGSAHDKEFYIQWHLTNKCNLRCEHCYQDDYSQSSELSFDELKTVAEKINYTLAKWGKEGRIGVTGGEPFVRNDLFDFLEFLEQQSHIKKIGILSNGTLLGENIQRIKKLSKLHYIQLSVEGTRETNDGIRGKGIFDKVMESTRLLKSENMPVRWMVTLHEKNVADVPQVIDLALENNVDTLTFERLVPEGSGKSFADYVLSRPDLEKIFTYIVNRSDAELAKGSPLAILKLRTLWVLCDPQRAEKTSNVSMPLEKEVGASCSIGVDSLCILPDATVLPCRRLPIPIGNLKDESLFRIWYTSKVLWDIRNKKNLKGKCTDCEFIPRCGGCRATAYAMTGDYLAEDPQCWKKTA